MDKYKMLHTKYYAALFSINSYFETEPDIQSIIQPDVQDAAQTTLEMLLSILNFDFIRKDIEFTSIYKEILYASEGMLKYWYRTGNYDVTVFEQEYLEMINHWEMVYGKGTETSIYLLSKRARAGCHKVQWTLALARPRSDLALREIEPLQQSSWVSRSASRVPQGPVDLGFGTTEESFSSPRNRTHAAKQHAFEKCLALLG